MLESTLTKKTRYTQCQSDQRRYQIRNIEEDEGVEQEQSTKCGCRKREKFRGENYSYNKDDNANDDRKNVHVRESLSHVESNHSCPYSSRNRKKQ